MQRLEVSGAVRSIYGSLGFKRLILEVCHPRCVSELERVCSQTQLCQWRCL